jgi:ubiquinone/menaquinone biosynthesis C-methylase UbiE
MNEKKLEFWSDRALNNPDNAGTDDFMLKKIENDVILDNVESNSRILDLGCGNGETLFLLAKYKNCRCVGIDFSEEMLDVAKKRCHNLKVDFYRGSILDIPSDIGLFDVIVTQRSLINLDSIEQQKKVFNSIFELLEPKGLYLMVETFNDGLKKINELREMLGLYLMEKPWHNLFLNEADINSWQSDAFFIEEFSRFASTYYLFSRVLYAKLAEINDESLRYDSDINKISCMLPPVGDIGYVQMVKWKKS